MAYIEELYRRNGPENYLERLDELDEDDKGNIIMRSEFVRAHESEQFYRDMDEKKATVIDRIFVALLSALVEVSDRLYKIVSKIYELATDFKKNVVMVAKIKGVENLPNSELSLTSHATKCSQALLKDELKENARRIRDNYFGFRKRSREAIDTHLIRNIIFLINMRI